MRWLVLLVIAVIGAALLVASRGSRDDAGEVRVERDAGGVEPDEAAVRLQGHPTVIERERANPEAQSDRELRVRKLRARLKSSSKADLIQALGDVAGEGLDSKEFLGAVLPLLDHEDGEVGEAVVAALAAMGEAVVDPLITRILKADAKPGTTGSHSGWGYRASWVLNKVGQPAVLPVAELLGDEDSYFWAFVTFSRFRDWGTDPSSATPVVLRRLDEVEDEGPLSFVIDAVAHLGPYAAQAVPKLVRFLSKDGSQVQISAVKALGRIGPDASGALTELERLRRTLPERSGVIRQVLEEAIARIRGEE